MENAANPEQPIIRKNKYRRFKPGALTIIIYHRRRVVECTLWKFAIGHTR
jgi:hypothetical protein